MAVMRQINKENPRQKKQPLPSTKWKVAFGVSIVINLILVTILLGK